MRSAYNRVYEIKINTYGSGVQGKVGGTNPRRDKASNDRRTTRVCVCSTPRAVSCRKTMGSVLAQNMLVVSDQNQRSNFEDGCGVHMSKIVPMNAVPRRMPGSTLRWSDVTHFWI